MEAIRPGASELPSNYYRRLRSKGGIYEPIQVRQDTQVGQVQGVFKARRKEMSMAALIPGLPVKVEGSYNDQKQLEAKSVSFKGNDLEQAESIQAGLHETKVEAQKSKEELEKQQAALKQQQAQLTEQQQKIAANKAAVDAAVMVR
jgi:hypothetical protein